MLGSSASNQLSFTDRFFPVDANCQYVDAHEWRGDGDLYVQVICTLSKPHVGLYLILAPSCPVSLSFSYPLPPLFLVFF